MDPSSVLRGNARRLPRDPSHAPVCGRLRSPWGVVVAQLPVELILVRQLAHGLAVPTFVVDAAGDLVFVNEAAEGLLGLDFEDVGQVSFADWTAAFASRTKGRRRADPATHPLAIAIRQRDAGPRSLADRGSRRRPSVARGDRSPPGGHSRSAPRWSRHVLGATESIIVRLWGKRGSLASSGPETAGYGGNTAAVETVSADGTILALDAGTGIRRLGAVIDPSVERLDVLLTHHHMDHIQGLGFFAPFFRPSGEIARLGPSAATMDLRARLTRYPATALPGAHPRPRRSRRPP